MSTVVRVSLLVVLASMSGAACTAARAAAPADRPALDVPAPPPRVIAQLPPPEVPQPEPIEELPTGIKPASPTKPARTAARDPKEAPKPEPKPETQPPTEPPAQPPPAAPPLRMPEGDVATLSKQIRESIDRSRQILKTTDRAPLSNTRKKTYDDATLFAQQAEDALNAKNLVFAKELADKAERLAKELQAR